MYLLPLLLLSLLFSALPLSSPFSPSFPLYRQSHVAALVDFNDDKFTDVVTVQPGTATTADVIQIFLFSSSGYSSSPSLSLTVAPSHSIVNIACGDYNQDGRADLLVMSKERGQEEGNETLQLEIYLGNVNSFLSSSALLLPAAIGQPLLVDWNGDFLLDLYGVRADTKERAIWVNELDNDGHLAFSVHSHNISSYPLPASPLVHGALLPSLAQPAGHAFVDVNGDCMADLFVTSSDPVTGQAGFEVWLNRGPAGFALHANYLFSASVAAGLGLPAWQDVNADGTMDLVFPYCLPADSCDTVNTMHIFYNIQKPMCSNVWEATDSECRGQQDLCAADDKFYMDPLNELDHDSANHIILPRALFAPYQFSPLHGVSLLASQSALSRPPLIVRFGDLNKDGYPDLLISMRLRTSAIVAERPLVTQLWMNVECRAPYCSQAAVDSGKRAYQVDSPALALAEAYFGTFLDSANRGLLDILYASIDPTSGVVRPQLLTNDGEYDAYFLTVSINNGVCPSWCDRGPKFPDPVPYGSAQPGATVKFTLTDLNGNKGPRMGTALMSTSHLALSAPYLFFGLSRTNNYIEEFFVGMPSRYPDYWQLWVAMIPNAQIQVFPSPPNSPADWTIELFISPSNKLLAVTLALLSILAVNGVAVMYFHYREMKEDEKEKTKNELLFTF